MIPNAVFRHRRILEAGTARQVVIAIEITLLTCQITG